MNFKAEKITSKQNPRIKNLVHLQKSNERLKQNLFIIEGLKEIEKAILADYEFDSLFYCPEIIDPNSVISYFKSNKPKHIFEIDPEIFNKIAYRHDSGGMLLLAKPKSHDINELVLPVNPLILVIEGVEKPGNIGAIYRTADAADLSAIIICNPATDFYNPNAVRASLGCIFTIPTIITSSNSAVNLLKNNNIQILTTFLKASVPYHRVDYTKPTAIVMGAEATGISELWINASDSNIIIPMRGAADSMNVSTSAAIIIFEASRQRGF